MEADQEYLQWLVAWVKANRKEVLRVVSKRRAPEAGHYLSHQELTHQLLSLAVSLSGGVSGALWGKPEEDFKKLRAEGFVTGSAILARVKKLTAPDWLYFRKVHHLRRMARAHRIKCFGIMRKEELINRLIEHV